MSVLESLYEQGFFGHQAKSRIREWGVEVEQNSEIGPARPDDFTAIRALCNGFIDWCRSRYGENAWFVDRYYTPEAWAALLDSLPRLHSAPDGEILVARLNGKVYPFFTCTWGPPHRRTINAFFRGRMAYLQAALALPTRAQ